MIAAFVFACFWPLLLESVTEDEFVALRVGGFRKGREYNSVGRPPKECQLSRFFRLVSRLSVGILLSLRRNGLPS